MEEITEGIGRGCLNLLKWVVIDLFIQLFVYGYGVITLKLITLGKYPKPEQDSETFCIVVGIISIAVTIGVIMFINSY